MVTSWHSYPKVYNFGHRTVREIFDGNVIIEEKIDGSQFSFGIFNGHLRCKSHNKELDINAPDNMFAKGVESVKSIAHMLKDGWTYRGEYLQKPKHNTLAYDRTPKGNIIIFDINDGEESYLSYIEKYLESERIGLECVPLISNSANTIDELNQLLESKSILGGQMIEGVVVKNYAKFVPDGKVQMAKHVSERFKEVHRHDWKDRNPGQGDIVERIGQSLRTPARWDKAVQHLREDGLIQDSPNDIGPLLKAISKDVHDECADDIKDQLFKWAWPQIQRTITRGFPEHYKKKLVEMQFSAKAI